jgi:hypothetical protein
MINPPAELWPWLALAGLGLYHGINPAMGWLFAVALGLHRKSHRIVLLSLFPIALGHAISVAAVLAAVLMLGFIVDRVVLARLAAVVLIGWAAWHALYGHRQRTIIGMQTGLIGLVLWSFLMASVHGAGLMLLPALFPACASASIAAPSLASGAFPLALAALGIHTAAMLLAIAVISIVVYNWTGVAFLRRGWINLDRLWIAALVICGMILLIS